MVSPSPFRQAFLRFPKSEIIGTKMHCFQGEKETKAYLHSEKRSNPPRMKDRTVPAFPEL
jgi:hypothetical protein